MPPGPIPDEASNAVDARCLAATGCDRFGTWLPLYLRAYDDYRDASFTYLAAPLVLLMPDSLLAVRLVAVAIGFATVWIAYLLAKEMFGTAAALWTALWLAQNPQHVFWSHLGMEVILVPLAGGLALLAYVRCRNHGRYKLIGLAAGLLAVLYAGMMGKALVAILLVLFLTSPDPWLATSRRRPAMFLVAVLVVAAGSVPALQASLSGRAQARFDLIRLHTESATEFAALTASHYLSYFSPAYLLWPTEGIDPTFFRRAGLFGHAEVLCLLAGVLFLLRDRPTHARLLLLFLLLYPLPAALTQTVAPSRVLIGVPILQVVAGYGAGRLTERVGRLAITSVLLLGATVSGALVMTDLVLPPHSSLDEHLCGAEQRAIAAALTMARGTDLVLIDAVLPFSPTYALYFARPPVHVFQGKIDATVDQGIRLTFDNVLVAYLSVMETCKPNRRVLLVTAGRPEIAGARPLAWYGRIPEYGDISLYESY